MNGSSITTKRARAVAPASLAAVAGGGCKPGNPGFDDAMIVTVDALGGVKPGNPS